MDLGLTLYGIAYIIALIIPGLFFKRFYFQGKFSKEFTQGLFADRIITNIFWSIFIQIGTLFLYCYWHEIPYDRIVSNLNLVYSKVVKDEFPDIQFFFIRHVIKYIGLSVVVAIGLGSAAHFFVRLFRLDVRFSVFRFSNQWHYYFTGDILKTKGFKIFGKKGVVLSTDIDVVIKESDGRTNMFTGTLSEYTVDRFGDLETLFLTNARRWKVKKDSESQADSRLRTEIKNIPGDCFVIPYKNILNLNIRYNFLSKGDGNENFNILTRSLISVLGVAYVLFLFFTIVYPWIVAPGFWKKLFSFLFLMFSSTFLLSLLLSFNQKEQGENKVGWGARAIIVLLIVICFLVGLLFAGTIEFYQNFPFVRLRS